MRNLLHIESIVQKPTNSQQFDYNDITNTLFFNIQPIFVIQPFKDLKNLVIQNISLPLSLFLSYKPLTIYSMLEKSFPYKNTFNYVLQLPAWMLGRVVEKYKEGVDSWSRYLMDNLKEYCKTFESKWYWSTLRNTGKEHVFKGEITVEKMLWIYFCENLDKEEQADFILKIREGLLPWFNYELWQQMEKKKENTRENVKFEEIREKILFNSSVKDEDLDIIG